MKMLLKQMVVVVLIAIASAIYTRFSHGVTSPYMTYAFAWPLIGFGLHDLFNLKIKKKIKKNVKLIQRGLWLSYMLNATLGSIIVGIIQIAGSYSELLFIQLIVGLISLSLYLLLSIVMLFSLR